MSVDRYEFIYYDDFGATFPAFREKDEDGDYVAYSDYEALEKSIERVKRNAQDKSMVIERLEKERDRYREALEKIAESGWELGGDECMYVAQQAIAGEV